MFSAWYSPPAVVRASVSAAFPRAPADRGDGFSRGTTRAVGDPFQGCFTSAYEITFQASAANTSPVPS